MQTDISQTCTQFRACISHRNDTKLLDVITHSCRDIRDGFIKPPVNVTACVYLHPTENHVM